ncbi:hypothetical protein H2200_010082 [Cladophialophora chaetospira]|uniref:von Willebrand domain containing protein n=1 Tax=Cladophialophora chaetospira TaxID=386627 RepID=A0AA38X2A8_9EURO|nr:hypothetical protein H2200_010082 [Cladophialophora chaetospira]
MNYYNRDRFCGCWIPFKPQSHPYSYVERRYLPQVNLVSSTTILATTSRTTLKQTFVNDQNSKLDEVQYTFPLYDGVSVVGFTCKVGLKTIVGVVKEKQQARVEYQAAVDRGETAGLLEQLPEASDVFSTSVGNVPAKEKVHIEITYLGELKHDAETDGSRFTIPTIIAPRYGTVSTESASAFAPSADAKGGISISVDVTLDDGTIVRGLQSPSHPIAVTMGRTSEMDEDSFSNNHASATLTLGTTELDKDFIIVVFAKGTETPRALLETHPTIPNQRAIMTTLVPKFNIPNISPEIVFVVDRSGSMQGKIELVVSAMKIFLKSLPIGVKFNICSFGSRHSFLFEKSKTYDQSSLKEALSHLQTFSANFGGTEMLQPVKATIENRYNDLPLEVMLLTDGEIWNQDELFTVVNQASNARFFTLGIGHGASSALVEGIARAGNGFAQFVGENEKMDKRVVRMLKGALTPHISDYTLEVNYDQEDAPPEYDDFEMVDSVPAEKTKSVVTDLKKPEPKKAISLFDTSAKEETTNPPAGRYDNLPDVAVPKVLQAPYRVPALYPFNRTTVYLLLGPDAPNKKPTSVTLRGTSQHGPLELQIPVQDIGVGETLHQLAAKKAVHELEQGRGWITEARADGKLLKTAHEGKWDLIVEREAVRLGVQFQVGGKWCSFVAVEQNGQQVQDATKAPAPRTNSTREASEESYIPYGALGESQSRLFPPASNAPSLFGSSSSAGRDRVCVAAALAPPQTPQMGSLFGAAVQVPIEASGPGGLFGAATTTSSHKPSTSGSLFGTGLVNTQQSSCFGASRPTSGGFGASAPPSAGSGLFGKSSVLSSSSSVFASNSLFGSGGIFGSAVCSPADSAQTAMPSPSIDVSSVNAEDYVADSNPAAAQPRGSGFSPSVANARRRASPPFAAAASLGFGGGGAPGGAPMGMQMMQQASPQMAMQMSAPMAHRSSAAPTQLQDYQMGLMTLEQQNKNRKQMMPQSKPATAYTANFRAPGPPPPPTASQHIHSSRDQLISLCDTSVMASASGPNFFRKMKRKATKAMPRQAMPLADDDEDEETISSLGGNMDVDVQSLPDSEKMHKIIDLQEFDGSWQVSDKLLELLGVSEEQFSSLNVHVDLAASNKAHKATALAIAWLRAKVAGEEDVWEMVVEKALGWLVVETGGEVGAEEAVKLAGKLF